MVGPKSCTIESDITPTTAGVRNIDSARRGQSGTTAVLAVVIEGASDEYGVEGFGWKTKNELL